MGKRKKTKGRKNASSQTTYDCQLRKMIEADGSKSVIEMAADGNCLFRSLSDQLYHDFGNKHEEVRAEIADFLEEHEEEFSVFLVLDEDEEDEDAANFMHYVEKMRQSGEWGRFVRVSIRGVSHSEAFLFSDRAVGSLRRKCGTCDCGSPLSVRRKTLRLEARNSWANKLLIRRNITAYSASLAAFTIDHGHANKPPAGPDLLVSYHDNDHYNSVRENSKGKPPPPIKTFVKPGAAESREKAKSASTEAYLNELPTFEGDSDDGENADQDGENEDDGGKEDANQETTVQGNTGEEQCTEVPHTDGARRCDSDIVVVNEEKQTRLKKNDPCPCGSGLRYKKCCLAREKHNIRLKRMQGESPEETEKQAGDSRPGDRKNDEDNSPRDFRVLRI